MHAEYISWKFSEMSMIQYTRGEEGWSFNI